MFYFVFVKNHFMDVNIKRYLKSEYYRGKGLAARLIDSFFFRILAFMVIFLFFWLLHTGFWRSVILGASLVSSFSILKFVFHRCRYNSFSQQRLERAAEECALERLILMKGEESSLLARRIFSHELDAEEEELRKSGGGFVWEKTYCRYFDVHPKHTVGIEEMTGTVREMRELKLKKCVMLTPSSFDGDARAMAVRHSDSCIFLEKSELLKRLKNTRIYPDEKEVYEYLSAEIAEKRITREKLFSAFFSGDKGRSFALCAAVLMAMPLFTGFNIIYPVAATVCAGLSFYGFVKGRSSKN